MGFITRTEAIQEQNEIAAQEAAAAAAQVKKEAADAETNRVWNLPPTNSWRIVDGRRVMANGEGWFRFWGAVRSVSKRGVVMAGVWQKGEDYHAGNFLLTDYPYPLADHDALAYDASWWAKDVGVQSIGGETLHHLDYGVVWIPPPPHVATAEEIKQANDARLAAREEGRVKAEAAALAYNEAAAERGDAYGLLRMGERYRDGDGVAKDLLKAREYLAKGAAAGNSQASKELLSLKIP